MLCQTSLESSSKFENTTLFFFGHLNMEPNSKEVY